ncbi:uncharacterized protein [Watersipora subatra]|uniref:uncharacterized protein n=1 Tax=Watersipora subatra TaxID=2589382 RepID=UPI00355C7039
MDLNLAICILLISLLLICAESSTPKRTESYCAQLGCDQAGTFTQDDFKFPMKTKMNLNWIYKRPMMAGMSDQNNNYGCVGSSKIIACPYRENMSTPTRHLILNADTGEEYDFSRHVTISNVSMPILVEDDLLFAVNNSHASLIDTHHNSTYVRPFPQPYQTGVHSPIYLPKLGYLLIFGNLSEVHLLYKVMRDKSTGAPELNLLATMTVEKVGKDCSWLPYSEIVANGNRVFFYGVQRDEIYGIVALDFFPTQPYYKKAWEFSDESSHLVTWNTGSGQDTRNCSYYPETNPDFSIFPAVDVNTQLLATPDHYIVITMPVGLLVFRDLGTSGEQVYNINVTSRIASFPDPAGATEKVLVFGVSVNTTSSQVPFHQKYCPECKPGINKMLMVIHSSLITTEQPDILWMAKLPAENWEVRGQIIGVKDKLITFLSDGKSGNIAAFS